MTVQQATEVSYVLASKAGRVVMTFDANGEARAREEASRRGLVLLRRTTTSEEVQL